MYLAHLRNVWLYLHRKYCYRLWGGEGELLRDALSHFSKVLLGVSRFSPRTIHSSDPLVVIAVSNQFSSFFFLTPVTTSLIFPILDEDAGILGDRVRANWSGLLSHVFLFLNFFVFLLSSSYLMPLLSRLLSESLLVEVDCVSEA